MQAISILFSFRKTCSACFFFWTPSAFHCTVLRAVAGIVALPVALLCAPLVTRFAEQPAVWVDPLEAEGPGAVPAWQ